MWDRGEDMGTSGFFRGSHWERERWGLEFSCHIEPWGPVALSSTPLHMNH